MNYKVFILDRYLRHQPIGIPGELCIAGVGLARGYLNRPELSAEKFVETELFGKVQRIYKTGDLARWLPDGNLEYLGRLDHQIKLRGFRIELGEIEAALSQHESVKEAVVAIYDKDGNKRMIAYVTLTSSSDGMAGLLRSWLKERLPEYMVPSAIIVMERLPLTKNGKFDRNLLPPPDLASKDHLEPPRTDNERKLVKIWSHVLKQADIGIHDNFFEQGGDSILSIQIVSNARVMGLEISPRDLFKHQTIAELALAVREAATFVAEQGPVSGKVPLTPIQQAFFDRRPSQPWHFNQAVLLATDANLNSSALEKALAALLVHHDALRLRYGKAGNETQQWEQWHVEPEHDVPFHTEDLSELPAEQFPQVLEERADFWQASLDLEKGPLLRMVLFNHGKEVRLLWCIHHLIVDGVSWRILFEDFQTAYHQAQAEQLIHFSPKTSAFKAWAEHIHAWKKSESLAEDADYWRNLPRGTPLPLDNSEASNRLIDARHYTISLQADATRCLLTKTQVVYQAQINDLLLTALMLTLRDWVGDAGHLIDLETHGRADLFEDIDLSRTVGWFTALHPVHLELPHTIKDIRECIQSIKQQLRKVPNYGASYGVLRYLNGEALAQGQILFNYLGQFDQGIQDSLFRLAQESIGQSGSMEGECHHSIEINGRIVDGQLGLTWSYSGMQFESATIQDLANAYLQHLRNIIEQGQNQYQSQPDLSTLIPLHSGVHQPDSSRPPLFCVPGVGSVVGYFRSLAAHLDPAQPVYGLQSPGLDNQTYIPSTVEALASHHIKVICHIQPVGPYYLAGHSFGSAVAFEMARQLEQRGVSVGLLSILDQPIRCYTELGDTEHKGEIDWILNIVELLKAFIGADFPVSSEVLRDSNNPQYCYVVVMNWLKQHHAHEIFFSAQARPEELRAMVQVYKVNARAFQRYKLARGTVLKCPIDLYCAEESLKALEHNKDIPEHWGWAEHTLSEVRIHKIPGEHIMIFKNPYVKTLADLIETRLKVNGLFIHGDN